MKLSKEQIQHVIEVTRGQRNNAAWQLARKGRLTSSNFGAVLSAKRTTPSLMKKLLGEHDLSGVKAIQWGVNNGAGAIKEFESQTQLHVQETRIWLDECELLGASPDGLVEDDSVLESKCPYTQRNMTIAKAVESPDFYLKKDDRGNFYLREYHTYWHQVQEELFFTKRKLCYFVVLTTKETVFGKVFRSDLWGRNLTFLKNFYLTHLFPKIIEGEL